MKYSKLSDYDYHLPEELIAQKPLEKRDQSRMMILNKDDGAITHSTFNRFPDLLEEGDLLVLNNTRVIPARLEGKIEGKTAPAELLLLHKLVTGHWLAMVKPGKKLKPGAKVIFEKGVEAEIMDIAREGLRVVSFNCKEPLEKILPEIGKVPLPPYIESEIEDPDLYQTVYAEEDGSAAAPTAGFHFTEEMIKNLKNGGVRIAYITLHIGPGTFQPVKTENIRDHIMHFEYYSIEAKAVRLLNMARNEGKKVIPVGTTVTRVLETVANDKGKIDSGQKGWTGLYIYPGYKFKVVDAMLTNFHLPQSTLLMLVSALAGYENTMAAYREAVAQEYRFFSFGDCMLIL
ncbi:MAG: tRNA preQ1(34) S-adenosylmethionine ribosyltransferase-isomerase QueA [Bacillota bacterium]